MFTDRNKQDVRFIWGVTPMLREDIAAIEWRAKEDANTLIHRITYRDQLLYYEISIQDRIGALSTVRRYSPPDDQSFSRTMLEFRHFDQKDGTLDAAVEEIDLILDAVIPKYSLRREDVECKAYRDWIQLTSDDRSVLLPHGVNARCVEIALTSLKVNA